MFEIKIVVRYQETDAQGIVHHSNYAVWLECARNDHMTHIGYKYVDLEKAGVYFVVRNLNIDFKQPVRFGDEVVIRLRLKAFNGVKIEHCYEVMVNGVVCVSASSQVVAVIKENDVFKLTRLDRINPALYQAINNEVE